MSYKTVRKRFQWDNTQRILIDNLWKGIINGILNMKTTPPLKKNAN